MLQFANDDEAQLWTLAHRTREAMTCYQTASHKALLYETDGTIQAETTTDAGAFGNGIHVTYQADYTYEGRDCTQFKDTYWNTSGSFALRAVFTDCASPVPTEAAERLVNETLLRMHTLDPAST